MPSTIRRTTDKKSTPSPGGVFAGVSSRLFAWNYFAIFPGPHQPARQRRPGQPVTRQPQRETTASVHRCAGQAARNRPRWSGRRARCRNYNKYNVVIICPHAPGCPGPRHPENRPSHRFYAYITMDKNEPGFRRHEDRPGTSLPGPQIPTSAPNVRCSGLVTSSREWSRAAQPAPDVLGSRRQVTASPVRTDSKACCHRASGWRWVMSRARSSRPSARASSTRSQVW